MGQTPAIRIRHTWLVTSDLKSAFVPTATPQQSLTSRAPAIELPACSTASTGARIGLAAAVGQTCGHKLHNKQASTPGCAERNALEQIAFQSALSVASVGRERSADCCPAAGFVAHRLDAHTTSKGKLIQASRGAA